MTVIWLRCLKNEVNLVWSKKCFQNGTRIIILSDLTLFLSKIFGMGNPIETPLMHFVPFVYLTFTFYELVLLSSSFLTFCL